MDDKIVQEETRTVGRGRNK